MKKGKLAGKGYAKFMQEHNTLNNLQKFLDDENNKDMKKIFVKFQFKQDYSDQPKNSLLFGKANEYKALMQGTWGTEFVDELKSYVADLVVVKNRVSPFTNKELDKYLKNNNIKKLYLAGVSTDLVVMSAAKDAHDLDYEVFVLADACAAANQDDHDFALRNMSKYAKIVSN